MVTHPDINPVQQGLVSVNNGNRCFPFGDSRTTGVEKSFSLLEILGKNTICKTLFWKIGFKVIFIQYYFLCVFALCVFFFFLDYNLYK